MLGPGVRGPRAGVPTFAAILLLFCGAGFPVLGVTTATSSEVPLHLPGHPESQVPSQQIALATESLSIGKGPANGVALDCSATGFSGSCNAPQSASTLSSNSASPRWGIQSQVFTPIGGEMAYDSRDGYVVYLNPPVVSGHPWATWTFENGSWLPLSGPQPSIGGLLWMVFDAKDGYVLAFGGYFTPQTWAFSGGTWTQLSPMATPPLQSGESVAYDSLDGYVLLLDSYPTSNSVSCYTWAYTGGVWRNLCPTTTPLPRSGAGMTSDSADGYVVLFGGYGCRPGCSSLGNLDETWTYRNGSWNQLSPSTSPGSRTSVLMKFDPSIGSVVLFGPATSAYADSWEFTAGNWTFVASNLQFANGTAGSSTMSFDPAIGGILLISSSECRRSNALPAHYACSFQSEFINGTWVDASGTLHHPSPARVDSAFWAYDWADRYVALFPLGYNRGFTCGNCPVVWTYRDGNWSEIPSNLRIPFGSQIVYDAADGYLLMFNGGNTWSYRAGNWTAQNPALLPPPTSGSSLCYDDKDGYVLLFGGTTYSSSSGTVYPPVLWKYRAGTWTNISSQLKGGPLDRQGAVLVNDTHDGYVVMFGGYNSFSGYFNDTWSYVAGNWTRLHPTTSPTVSGGVGLYDPSLGEALLFQGTSCWAFHNGTWRLVASSSGLHPFSLAGITFDGRQRDVLALDIVAHSIPHPQPPMVWSFGVPSIPLTLSERGLPTGANWSVAVYQSASAPEILHSSVATARAFLQNGTYIVIVAGPTGFRALTAAYLIHEPSRTASIQFQFVRTYQVTFKESGLPSSTSWSVTVGGISLTSTTSSIAFEETAGNWTYEVSQVGTHTPKPSTGYVLVHGAPVSILVKFS